MGVSFGQVLIAFLAVIFLVGKYPRILKDFHSGVQNVRQFLTHSDTNINGQKKEEESFKDSKSKEDKSKDSPY